MSSSWTNRILAANDFGSVQVIISRDLLSVVSFSGINIVLCVFLSQINVANIDPETGKSTKTYATYAFSGFIRQHVSLYTDYHIV